MLLCITKFNVKSKKGTDSQLIAQNETLDKIKDIRKRNGKNVSPHYSKSFFHLTLPLLTSEHKVLQYTGIVSFAALLTTTLNLTMSL